jgi:hypothetical protein
MKYILYNPCDNRPIDYILKYLDYLEYNLEPSYIHNSIMDMDIDMDIDLPNLPMIYTYDNKWYIGENQCIQFYSDATLILHLKDKADNFNKYELSHPFYPRKLRKIKIE